MNIDNIKIGVAISTYANDQTSDKRIMIVKECLDSFIGLDISVIIVNDASKNEKHLNLINSYTGTDFVIINKPENGGIAKCKNTAIKYFEQNDYDYIFLSDDDVKILNKDFFKYYIEAHDKTGIHHFCYQCVGNHNASQEAAVNNFSIMKSDHTNGCFLMLTKEVIKKIGYFKILPHKYGHEHSNYTMRCILNSFAPTFVDIVNSSQYIKLIPDSLTFDAGARISGANFDENMKIAICNLHNEKYIDCVE